MPLQGAKMEYDETTAAKKQAEKPDCTDKNVLIKRACCHTQVDRKGEL